MKKLIVCIILVLFCVDVYAADWYVDNNTIDGGIETASLEANTATKDVLFDAASGALIAELDVVVGSVVIIKSGPNVAKGIRTVIALTEGTPDLIQLDADIVTDTSTNLTVITQVGSGTSGDPYAFIADAIAEASTGDTVYIKENGRMMFDYDTAANNGASGNPTVGVTITGQSSGATALVKGWDTEDGKAWVPGTAEGIFYIDSITGGPFTLNETLDFSSDQRTCRMTSLPVLSGYLFGDAAWLVGDNLWTEPAATFDFSDLVSDHLRFIGYKDVIPVSGTTLSDLSEGESNYKDSESGWVIMNGKDRDTIFSKATVSVFGSSTNDLGYVFENIKMINFKNTSVTSGVNYPIMLLGLNQANYSPHWGYQIINCWFVNEPTSRTTAASSIAISGLLNTLISDCFFTGDIAENPGDPPTKKAVIVVEHTSGSVTLDRNKFFMDTSLACFNIQPGIISEDGVFQADGTQNAQDLLPQNVVITNNTFIVGGTPLVDDPVVFHSIGRVDATNLVCANNTFAYTGSGAYFNGLQVDLSSTTARGGAFQIYNDIFFGTTNSLYMGNASAPGDIDTRVFSWQARIDYNCGPGLASLGIGNITGNPLFKNPANGDFSLQPLSPCLFTGRDNETMGGVPPDMAITDGSRSRYNTVFEVK